MKEVYDYRFEYKMDGWKDFVDTSIWKHVRYLTPEDAKTWTFTIKSFDELVGLVKDDLFMNAELSKNIFRKTVVRLSNVEDYLSTAITERNFKPIEVRCVYNKMSMSMKGLAETLDAESFCEYLKDRGITKI
jgi:hypothetical protein